MEMTFGIALVAAGAALLVHGMRKPVVDIASVLAELEGDHDAPLDEFTERLTQPLAPRLLLPAGRAVASRMRGLLPSQYIERLRRKLVVAGVADRLGPEEFVALQLIGFLAGALTGFLLSMVMGWGLTGSARAIGLVAILGAFGPVQWLQRSREARQMSIRRDLPDVLDLLAISVEAGVGLEGAIDVVGSQFDTPLAHELQRMLREMELGVSRRVALQHLKRRVQVPEFSNFVLSLIQADALGMPIGRVLRTQAVEMRTKRRQWAREKAGKLPVKIIFPLMTFILPALFVVIVGPAVISIMENVIN